MAGLLFLWPFNDVFVQGFRYSLTFAIFFYDGNGGILFRESSSSLKTLGSLLGS